MCINICVFYVFFIFLMKSEEAPLDGAVVTLNKCATSRWIDSTLCE